MSLITKEELEKAVELLGFDHNRQEALAAIEDVLSVVAPEKLMSEPEKQNIIDWCAAGHKLVDQYSYYNRQAAIEIQLPELHACQQALDKAGEDMEKMAQFLKQSPEEITDL